MHKQSARNSRADTTLCGGPCHCKLAVASLPSQAHYLKHIIASTLSQASPLGPGPLLALSPLGTDPRLVLVHSGPWFPHNTVPLFGLGPLLDLPSSWPCPPLGPASLLALSPSWPCLPPDLLLPSWPWPPLGLGPHHTDEYCNITYEE